MIRKVSIFLSISLLILSSCSYDRKSKETHYSHDQIKSAMIELYMASEALNNREIPIRDSLRSIYRAQIEEILEVDLDLIEQDILVIKQNPDTYLELHNAVVDSLESIEESVLKKVNITNESKNRTPVKEK